MLRPGVGRREDDMRIHVRLGSLLTLAACLLATAPGLAADDARRNLVDVRWLTRHLDDPGVLILDASLAPAYAAQHIPGAIHVDAFVYGGKELPLAEAERLYQSWGISPGKTIVLYDQGGSYLATRLFWALHYHGFPTDRLAILDGGLARWQAAQLPVTKDVPPPPARGTFTVSGTNEQVRVRLPEFLNASGDPANSALVEALGGDWHFGAVRAFDRAGHPPHGILLPSADLYNPDKTFKSDDELRRMLHYLGIAPEKQIYTYCGGGVAASAPFFALKFLLGYPNVKLYPESEMGWLSDERGLPYWTYDAPSLMRHAPWLNWSGGQRIRTFVGARVSIVDVRPPDAFTVEHVPFALNVPSAVFREHTGRLDELAGVLGAAGVDATHEAVVVSGGGLTKEAALAFVLLEALGQARTSVLVDSMARWAQQGFDTAKTATAVGPRTSPRDLSIEPTRYASARRSGVLITDPSATTGLYPKVFVASGAALPARAPAGTVAHVPYSELLTPDGAPKSAADLWTILTKAGVPRYAELVCVADDPAEAAAVYFVLKLMGYPDVKVLI